MPGIEIQFYSDHVASIFFNFFSLTLRHHFNFLLHFYVGDFLSVGGFTRSRQNPFFSFSPTHTLTLLTFISTLFLNFLTCSVKVFITFTLLSLPLSLSLSVSIFCHFHSHARTRTHKHTQTHAHTRTRTHTHARICLSRKRMPLSSTLFRCLMSTPLSSLQSFHFSLSLSLLLVTRPSRFETQIFLF